MLERLSWKAQRRLTWLGLLAVAGGIAAALVAFLPGHKQAQVAATTGKAQLVTEAKQVSLSAADRHAILRTLDLFVPAAVRRENPLAAYDLVTPTMRKGTTRA